MVAKPITWTCPGAVYDLALHDAAHLPKPMRGTVWGQHGARYTYELDVAEAHAIWTRLMEVGSDPALATDDLLAAAGRLDMAIMGAQRRSDDDAQAGELAAQTYMAGVDAARQWIRTHLDVPLEARSYLVASFAVGAQTELDTYETGDYVPGDFD